MEEAEIPVDITELDIHPPPLSIANKSDYMDKSDETEDSTANSSEESPTEFTDSHDRPKKRKNSRIFDEDYARRQSVLLQDTNATAISKYINIDSLTGLVKWSGSDEKIVRTYMFKSLSYKSLYNQAYFRYKMYHKLLTWPLILLSGVNLLLQTVYATLVTSDILSQAGHMTFSIIMASLTGIVTTLTYWRSRKSFDAQADGCRKAAIAFSEFADQIQTILNIGKEHRTNPLEVINTMQYDYKKIRKLYAEFEIPSKIYKDFIDKHGNRSIVADMATTGTENFNIFDNNFDRNGIVDTFLGEMIDMREMEENSSNDIRAKNNHVNSGGNRRSTRKFDPDNKPFLRDREISHAEWDRIERELYEKRQIDNGHMEATRHGSNDSRYNYPRHGSNDSRYSGVRHGSNDSRYSGVRHGSGDSRIDSPRNIGNDHNRLSPRPPDIIAVKTDMIHQSDSIQALDDIV